MFICSCLFLECHGDSTSIEPAGSADEYALQALEKLQEAATFMQAAMHQQMQRMKKYYDVSDKSQTFEEGNQGLLFDPCKKQGHYAKWHVSWKELIIVKKRLNDTNCMLQRSTKSHPFIVHVDVTRCGISIVVYQKKWSRTHSM